MSQKKSLVSAADETRVLCLPDGRRLGKVVGDFRGRLAQCPLPFTIGFQLIPLQRNAPHAIG
jgi:hypothetical protein